MEKITRQTTIGIIVDAYPEVVETLESFGVHCAGCHVSAFESIEDGFKSHGMTDVEIDTAVETLNAIVDKKREAEGISLSDSAVKKLQGLLQGEHKALRITVAKGGCSGFKYSFDLVSEKKDGDYVYATEDVLVYVDQESLEKIKGCVIDYKDSLQDAGFKVTNPLATATCGCGKSFR